MAQPGNRQIRFAGSEGAAEEGAQSPPGPKLNLLNEQQPPRTIHEAAERGLVGFIVRTVERAIEFDINQRDKYQRTALHWASELNQIEAAEALLDYGCDPTLCECNGRTAIHLAAREGHAEMLKLLTENMDEARKEALVNQRDNFGITPVYLSLQRGEDNRAAFELLMGWGGKYNAQTANQLKSVPSGSVEPPPVEDTA